MEKKDINIWDIYVPDKFLTGRPREYKIMGMEAYHKKYKKFCGRILIDKNGTLLDGYVIYYVAKKNKINTTKIEQKYFNEITIKNTEEIKLLHKSFDK